MTPSKPPFQFGLGSLMGLMAAVAVATTVAGRGMLMVLGLDAIILVVVGVAIGVVQLLARLARILRNR